MIDIEKVLSEALVVSPPDFDEARLRAGVARRLVRRRQKLTAVSVASVVGAVTIALLFHQRRLPATPEPMTVAAASNAGHASGRKPTAARRPIFAAHPLPAPRREDRVLAEELGRLTAALETADPDDRAELLFRLGEVHNERRESLERGSSSRAEAAAAALAAWRSLFDDPRQREADRRDDALFESAYLLFDEGRQTEAQPLFQRLLDEHPTSSLAPNAEVARAEFFFEDGDLKTARKHYEAVVRALSSSLWVYAQYKLGWVHQNLGERDASLAAFARVVTLADAGQLGEDTPTSEVVAECRKDLAALRDKR